MCSLGTSAHELLRRDRFEVLLGLSEHLGHGLSRALEQRPRRLASPPAGVVAGPTPLWMDVELEVVTSHVRILYGFLPLSRELAEWGMPGSVAEVRELLHDLGVERPRSA